MAEPFPHCQVLLTTGTLQAYSVARLVGFTKPGRSLLCIAFLFERAGVVVGDAATQVRAVDTGSNRQRFLEVPMRRRIPAPGVLHARGDPMRGDAGDRIR